MENLPAIIEALILASEAPLVMEKIFSVLDGVEKSEIKEAIEKLIADYEERNNGICIQEVAGGYQFRTRPEFSEWVKKLKGVKPTSLSPAALETLAIVAYRQPIVKAEIESIRGVDVSAPLKGLMEKKLIRIVGRKDVPGKPIIYGTTKKFLEVFNLKELTDLPTMRELKEITEQQEVYEQETIDFDELQNDIQAVEAIHQAAEDSVTDEVQAPRDNPEHSVSHEEAAGAEDLPSSDLPEHEKPPQETPQKTEDAFADLAEDIPAEEDSRRTEEDSDTSGMPVVQEHPERAEAQEETAAAGDLPSTDLAESQDLSEAPVDELTVSEAETESPEKAENEPHS